MNNNKLVTIFGGSGFLGKYIVAELTKLGYRINVITRNPSQCLFLKTAGDVGQVSVTYANIHNDESLEKCIQNSQIVINCIGLLFEKGDNSFTKMHIDLPTKMAKYCKHYKVERFIHISAMGIDNSSSKYARSKLDGERCIVNTYPDAIIIRPNLLFGTEDNFFNKFACMAKLSPVMPLFGGGKTLFQPVYVLDVANAIVKLITDPKPLLGTYELFGKDKLSFKDIIKFVMKTINVKRPFVSLPFNIAGAMGKILKFLPVPPFTDDQIESLKYDCIFTEKYKSFKELGIQPARIEHIVPRYLNKEI